MPKAKKGKKKDDDEWFDSAAEKKIEEQLKALGLDAKDDDNDPGLKKVIKIRYLSQTKLSPSSQFLPKCLDN